MNGQKHSLGTLGAYCQGRSENKRHIGGPCRVDDEEMRKHDGKGRGIRVDGGGHK